MWSITRGARIARYSHAHTYEVKRIAFSHDDARVVSADNLQIKEWAREAADVEDTVRAAGKVKLAADGQRVVVVRVDGRLGVWDVRTGLMESAIPPVSGPAFGDPGIGPADGIAVAAKAARVLSWNEKLQCVWDLEAGVSVGCLSTAATRDAAITADGTAVVSVDGYGITLWRPDDGTSSVLGRYKCDPPGYVEISPDGKRALSSGGERKVVVWCLDEHNDTEQEQLRSQRQKYGLSMGAEITSCWINSRDKPALVVFASPNKAIVTTGDGSLFLLDMSEYWVADARGFEGRHGASVSDAVVSDDGNFAVTSSADGTNRVWNLTTRQCVAVLDAHPGYIEKISTGLKRALLFTRDGILKIVSLQDGALLAAFQGDMQFYTCDADADVQWVVACDQGGQMHFLHLEHAV